MLVKQNGGRTPRRDELVALVEECYSECPAGSIDLERHIRVDLGQGSVFFQSNLSGAWKTNRLSRMLAAKETKALVFILKYSMLLVVFPRSWIVYRRVDDASHNAL